MTFKKNLPLLVFLFCVGFLFNAVFACPGLATPPRMKMTTNIPPEILTPDKMETRLGTLNFFDGYPTPDTVQKLYDNLLFIRGVEVFLNAIPCASMYAIREGLRQAGIKRNGIIVIHEKLMSPKSLYLTPNTESVYVITWLDLAKGPMVVESPPNTLGMMNDFFFRYVADLGNAGPDRGKGGKYLFLPPGYKGKKPKGYFIFQSPTFGNVVFWRGFLEKGDPKPAIEMIKKTTRIYPLAKPQDKEKTQFLYVSGNEHNTIHANNFKFYEEVNQVVQEEPSSAFSPEILGLLYSIGIKKGEPFKPNAHEKKILTEAVNVGNATARTISFHQRGTPLTEQAFLYKDSAWFTPFVGGSHEFLKNGARLLDARTMFHFPATAITPAMAKKMVGIGSQYAVATQDSQKKYLDGSKNYRLRLPKGIPAKDFWSIVIYDPQTRSLLQTDQPFPSLNSERNTIQQNKDGSTDIYFGPKPPEGKGKNWIQTIPGKGWFTILRLYGPLETWFEKTWRPEEIKMVK